MENTFKHENNLQIVIKLKKKNTEILGTLENCEVPYSKRKVTKQNCLDFFIKHPKNGASLTNLSPFYVSFLCTGFSMKSKYFLYIIYFCQEKDEPLDIESIIYNLHKYICIHIRYTSLGSI